VPEFVKNSTYSILKDIISVFEIGKVVHGKPKVSFV